MENKIVEIREIEKRWTGFQDIPRGDVENAYVFFQSKDNSKYTITTEKRKIMSAELRNGKYDRIMKIRRGWFDKKIYKVISCLEDGHFFIVDLNVEYYISDPEYIYQNRTYSVEVELERMLAGIEDILGDTYSFTKQSELSRDIRPLIMTKLCALPYLMYSVGLHIDVDENARELIASQRRHEVTMDRLDKEALAEQIRTRNMEDLKQMKMDSMGRYMSQYGANAGYLLSHVEGEMSGSELSQILKADKKEQTEMTFEMIMRLYKEGILDEMNLGGVLEKILPGIEQSTASGRIETSGDTSDKDEYEMHTSFQWKDS